MANEGLKTIDPHATTKTIIGVLYSDGGFSAPIVKVKRLRDNKLPFPQPQTPGAAGLDLAADLTTYPKSACYIFPGDREMIDTGFAFEIPFGFEGQMRPRSGTAYKHGITLINSPGTIDCDYRGEVRLLLINHSRETFRIEHGDRLAQLVIAPVVRCTLIAVDELSNTQRGDGGYGSTGIKSFNG